MKRDSIIRRGNDLLYKPRGEADEFGYYHGPFGGDMRSSILGPSVNNRDEIGGQQAQKVGRGIHGRTRPRSSRGDDQPY
jgi:hypothetical protein